MALNDMGSVGNLDSLFLLKASQDTPRVWLHRPFLNLCTPETEKGGCCEAEGFVKI